MTTDNAMSLGVMGAALISNLVAIYVSKRSEKAQRKATESIETKVDKVETKVDVTKDMAKEAATVAAETHSLVDGVKGGLLVELALLKRQLSNLRPGDDILREQAEVAEHLAIEHRHKEDLIEKISEKAKEQHAPENPEETDEKERN